MLGSLIIYLKGMRIMMLQLSGFYYRTLPKPYKHPIKSPQNSYPLTWVVVKIKVPFWVP